MRLVDWGGLYLALGLVCAVALARRAPRPPVRDLGLALVLWPVYVPVLLETTERARVTFPSEVAELAAAIAAVSDQTIARLLPTRAQLEALGAKLVESSARVTALDAALLTETPPPDDDQGPHADGQRRALARLAELRQRAHQEREDLRSLVRRLRVQITVIGFSGSATDDARDVAAEIAARVEGVGAAFETRGKASS